MRISIVLATILFVSLGGQGFLAADNVRSATLQSKVSDLYPNLDMQVKEYCESYVRGDLDRMVELTWPKYVERKGTQNLVADARAGLREYETLNARVAWVPESATQVIDDEGNLYAVVPTTMKITASVGVSTTAVCLIAISEDRGNHWSFVSASCINVKAAFPAIADRLVLCPERSS